MRKNRQLVNENLCRIILEILFDKKFPNIRPDFLKYKNGYNLELDCYNKELKLQYRGRLDESRKETAAENVTRDLYEAMMEIAKSGKGPAEQIPSMGCSIKWLE